MGIENRTEQDSNRNADSGPEIARLQTLEKKYLYWLTRIPGFGAVTIRRIWETVGSFEKAYYIEGMELKKLGILQSGKNAVRMTGGRNSFPVWSVSMTIYRRRESVS